MDEESYRSATDLASAVDQVIDIIARRPVSEHEVVNPWEQIVRTIAEHDSLPDGLFKIIEHSIAEAYDGWTDEQRRAIWSDTESAMMDDDDTSFDVSGYFLQNEVIAAVTQVAWSEAANIKKNAMAKKRRPKAPRTR